MAKYFSLIIGLIFLLSITYVSAVELNPFADKKIFEPIIKEDMSDFIKEEFNTDYGVIRISKTFFWIETDKIAEYSLIANTEQCFIDCESRGKATLYGDGNLFEDLIFKTIDGRQVDLNAEYYTKELVEYEVITPIYNETCTEVYDSKNDTTSTVCTSKWVEDLKEIRIKEVWNKYNGEVLTAGDYEWKIKAKKFPTQVVDFVPKAYGIELDDWAWWDGDWAYKQEIKIQENTGNAWSNYSVYLNITYDDNMLVNFSDLRFTDSGESFELPYYIESKIDSNSAKVWVKTPLTASDNTSIYMYYSNPSVTTTSNQTISFLWDDTGVKDRTAEYTISGGCNFAWGSGVYTIANGLSDCVVYPTGVNTSNSTGTMHGMDSGGAYGYNIGFGWRISNATYNYRTQRVNVEIRLRKQVGATTTDYHTRNIGMDATWHNWTYSSFGLQQNMTVNVGGTDYFVNKSDNTYATGFTGFYSFNDGGTRTYQSLRFREFGVPEPSYTFGIEQNSEGISVTPLSPTNAYKSNSQTINFNVSISTVNANITNVTWRGGSQTDFQTMNTNVTTILNWTKTFTDGSYTWNVTACWRGISETISCTDSATRSFQVDATSPYFVLNNISNVSTISLPVNNTFNISSIDVALQSCWYISTDHPVAVPYTCNATTIVSFLTGGTKNLTVFANDTFANVNHSSYYFNIYNFNVSSYENINPIAEGSQAHLYLKINSTNFAIGDADATILWNNTLHAPTTKTNVDANTILFDYSFIVTSGMGNSTGIPYYYNWTYNATQLTTRTTPTRTQTIISFGIDDCSVYTYQIANFSLRDEETNLQMSNTTSTRIEIETLTTSKSDSSVTWSYSNTWENASSVVLCVPDGVLNNSNFTIDITASYEANAHVKEFFFLDNGTLAKGQSPFNSYTPVNLSFMDLLASDSTTFLFEFTDEDGLSVDDAIIHTYRYYIGDGLFREVERSRQDDSDQTHVHLVEEDIIYYFVITQYGRIIYTSSEYNAKCLSTPCTIELTAQEDFVPIPTDWDLAENVSYYFIANKTTRNVYLYYTADGYAKMNITLYRVYNGVESAIVSDSENASSGTLEVNVPYGFGNQTFYVNLYIDDSFIKKSWIDFREDASDYFGTTGAWMGALMILTIILMAVTEGVALIIFIALGLIIVWALQLIDMTVYAVIYTIVAGGTILWSLSKRRRTPQ